MKKRNLLFTNASILLVAFLVMFNLNCASQEIKKELAGNWESQSTKITIRTKVKWMNYSFTSATINLKLNISPDNLASGSIGEAKFDKVAIKKNKGNTSITGISYIIPCGLIGNICKEDTTGLKTVELWVKPSTVKGILTAEIRLKDSWDTFPMGEATFYLR